MLIDMLEESDTGEIIAPVDNYILPEGINIIIENFYEWLKGPQGGGNKNITARQNHDMMKRLCKLLNVQSLNDLLDDTTLWRLFLQKKNSDEWKGQTSHSYMVAIKKILGYMVRDARHKRFKTEQQREYARYLMDDLLIWSKSYKNQIGIESAKKKIEQSEVLLDPLKIMKYRASEQYRSAVKLFAECEKDDFYLDSKMFNICRNFLLFNINYRNANRAGVLAEMSVEDYVNRKKFVSGKMDRRNIIMITVVDHKTLCF